MRARALRAPVFVSSLSSKTGRCAPPYPSQLRCFSFDPQKYIKSMELGPPTSEAMKYEVPCPHPPIAASLILSAIFWGQNYVPVRRYALLFSGFSFLIQFLDLFFLLFSYFSSLLFIFSYLSLLILLFLSLLILLVGTVRHVTGNDKDYLRKIPRVVW